MPIEIPIDKEESKATGILKPEIFCKAPEKCFARFTDSLHSKGGYPNFFEGPISQRLVGDTPAVSGADHLPQRISLFLSFPPVRYNSA